jgi:hypothetical protein
MIRTVDNTVPIRRVNVAAFTVPTDFPEADGTLQWDRTTMVLVQMEAGGKQGLGYTYADTGTARLITDTLAREVQGEDALSPAACWNKMIHRIRNLGRPGVCSMAISAVDTAVWDLKARLLDVPLVTLLGQVRKATPIYGSGGFTSYNDSQLQKQLGGWVKDGICHVKMKVGRGDLRNSERVRAARRAIGKHTALYVAMARAACLPARIAVGLVDIRGAFYYHAWPEVYLDEGRGSGLWLPVDPTLNQFPADATHLRLARGGLDKQAAILPLIGHLKMTVLELDLDPAAAPILVGRDEADLEPIAIPIPKRDAGGCWSRPPRSDER